jgi:FkbM family methyltransferase
MLGECFVRTYLKDCRWGRFVLLHGDMISEYVNLYGEWCEGEVQLFRSILSETSDVIEVGANIGMHSVAIAKFIPRGKLLCYEPQRIIHQILCANVAINNLTNAHLMNKAVADQSATISLPASKYDEPWNYGAFSIRDGFVRDGYSGNGVSPDNTIREHVDQTTLDRDLKQQHVNNLDLIKIDAEGAESLVLNGADATIARYNPYIFVEANNRETFDDLLANIKKRGYTCYWFLSKRARSGNYNRTPWTNNDSYDTNMICVPAGRSLSFPLVQVQGFGDLSTGEIRPI